MTVFGLDLAVFALFVMFIVAFGVMYLSFLED